jgi:hypothetical protein
VPLHVSDIGMYRAFLYELSTADMCAYIQVREVTIGWSGSGLDSDGTD